MSNTKIFFPKCGEIWIVNFDPTEGSEIKKTRPAVVVSSDALRYLPVKLVAPITEWDKKHESTFWRVKIEPNNLNNLNKVSAVDVLQLRCLDRSRFVNKKGVLSANLMGEIASAIAAVIEYQ